MKRTVCASLSSMTSLPSCARYPSGGTPPIHIPFFFEAAILSRMRSPMTSRSNCAKDRRTLRVRRPIEVVVLNCWVTDTKETPAASKISTIFAKSAKDRESRPFGRPSGIAAVVVERGQGSPPLVPLTLYIGVTGLALRMQGIEVLFQARLGRFPGVDGAAKNLSLGWGRVTHLVRSW